MKKSASKLFTVILWVWLLAFVLMSVFLVFLVIALANKSQFGENAKLYDVYEYFSSSFVNSETVYFFLVFLIILPVALLMLDMLVLPLIRPLCSRRKLQKMVKRAERKLAREARKEARRIAKQNKKINKMTEERFPRLKQIDEEEKNRKKARYDTAELDTLCENFRAYAASELGLYYEIEDIRRFIGGMGISRLIIIKGISGTGKTSLAYAAGEFFGNSSTIVPIQPMWKERSDLIGYFNEFTKKFSETSLLTKLYEARGRGDLYITVLDEVNISRIEYYFAEFLSLLEIPDASKRYLDVVADSREGDPERLENGRLLLPKNMWFVGTANNDDSTFSISDKVYDRAAVIDLDHKCAPFAVEGASVCHISFAELNLLFEKAKNKYSLSNENREKLAMLDSYMINVFRVSFGNRIMKQIESYIPIMIACGGNELDALDDLISHKILRKLEQFSPAFVKSEAGELMAFINKLFGSGKMPQCTECIEKMQKGY